MKYGTTSFKEGCMKGVAFEDFEKDHGKIVFRDTDNNLISHNAMFKAMGGVIKSVKKTKREED